jgi:molybdopterin molybdotransferase
MSKAEMVTRSVARNEIALVRGKLMSRKTFESVPVDQICGRFLAEDIVASFDLPSKSHATMDGYAFNANDEYPLELVDEVFPEDTPQKIGSGKAVRIATGAILPEGTNAVLKKEDSIVRGGELNGIGIEEGNYVYSKGSNVSVGEILFKKGLRLSPKDAILLLDLGYSEIEVYDSLKVGVLATGTEIYEGKHKDLDSAMLCGLISNWGADVTYEGAVQDEYEKVEYKIKELSKKYEVVITTGGTSVGKKDYVIKAISALGEICFQGVLVRPGKPITMATIDENIIFAIPGKPIGAYTVALMFLRPFFIGEEIVPTVDMKLTRDIKISREGFEYVVPVIFDKEENGVIPLGHVDSPLQIFDGVFNSSVLSSSTRAIKADGFFIMSKDIEKGTIVKVTLYTSMP